jgi:hypothetical protein
MVRRSVAAGLDQIRFAIHEEQIPVGVQIAEIAGV